MKNNKAFTIVEMLVSFTLSMILVIIMFQLIINLKEVYMSSGIKTEMMNKKYLITNKIYNDLNKLKVSRIGTCTDTEKCINFTYSNGTVKKLIIDEINKTLAYDNYIIKLNSNTNFGIIQIDTEGSSIQKKLLNIKVPIYNDSFKDIDFGINIVYPYSTQFAVNNSNYNYKIYGKTTKSSESTPTMSTPVAYTGFGASGTIQIKQGDTTLGTINMAGHDPLMCMSNNVISVCDYIDYDKSVIVRYIKKHTFTGSETFNTTGWAANNTETTKGVYWSNSTELGNYRDNKFKDGYGASTHFKNGDSAYAQNDTLRYGTRGSSDPPYLSFRIPIDTDMSTWTTEQYNAGTPLIAYYVLNNPEYEIISLPSINVFTDISSLTVTDGSTTSTIE